MPIHDWTRVEAGIFHDFHHAWIEEIKRALNSGLLPDEYYALAEQHTAGFGPDVLTLQGPQDDGDTRVPQTTPPSGGIGLLLARPKTPLTAETDMAFYRRKQSTVTVRHVSGDRIVAMVEVVSPGNKAARAPFRSFVELAAYESGLTVRAFVELVAVGDPLPDMPLFLEPGASINVPLEATYQAAFAAVPRRWRNVLESRDPA